MAEYIHRLIEKKIVEASSFFRIVTVTGPRQSGKTTMLRHLFPNAVYRSLEDPDIRQVALADPRRFLQPDAPEMIIDEIQRIPDLLSYLQGIADEKPRIKYYLTGSSNFELLHNITQSLAGRTAIFQLLPLQLDEIKEQTAHLNISTLLFTGFYPALWNNESIPSLFYPNYLRTYIERDLRHIIAVKDLDTYRSFLTLTAARIGSIFIATEISNELGIAANTVKAWLSTLNAAYIVFTLRPFFTNTRKRLVKSPKIYFTDTGVASNLLNIDNPPALDIDKMRGHIFENFIICNVLKNFYNKDKQPIIYFYRDSHGNEVDLLIKNKNKYDIIEIKSSQTFNPIFLKGLKSFSSEFPELTGRQAVVYAGDDLGSVNGVDILNYRTFLLDWL